MRVCLKVKWSGRECSRFAWWRLKTQSRRRVEEKEKRQKREAWLWMLCVEKRKIAYKKESKDYGGIRLYVSPSFASFRIILQSTILRGFVNDNFYAVCCVYFLIFCIIVVHFKTTHRHRFLQHFQHFLYHFNKVSCLRRRRRTVEGKKSL